MIRSSRHHLAEVDEGYFEHFKVALRIAGLLLRAALACAVHAVVPALCTTTASRTFVLLRDIFEDRTRVSRHENVLHRREGQVLGS